MTMKNPKYNSEGYADHTEYEGMKEVVKMENETERRVSELVKVLKFIIRSAGFELSGRIHLKDTKTGREYK